MPQFYLLMLLNKPFKVILLCMKKSISSIVFLSVFYSSAALSQVSISICDPKVGCAPVAIEQPISGKELVDIFNSASTILDIKPTNWFEKWVQDTTASYVNMCLDQMPGGRLSPAVQELQRSSDAYKKIINYKNQGSALHTMPNPLKRTQVCKEIAKFGIVPQCTGVYNLTQVMDPNRQIPMKVTLLKSGMPEKVKTTISCTLTDSEIDPSNLDTSEYSELSARMIEPLETASDASNAVVSVTLPYDYKPRKALDIDGKILFAAHGTLVAKVKHVKQRNGSELVVSSPLIVFP